MTNTADVVTEVQKGHQAEGKQGDEAGYQPMGKWGRQMNAAQYRLALGDKHFTTK